MEKNSFGISHYGFWSVPLQHSKTLKLWSVQKFLQNVEKLGIPKVKTFVSSSINIKIYVPHWIFYSVYWKYVVGFFYSILLYQVGRYKKYVIVQHNRYTIIQMCFANVPMTLKVYQVLFQNR